MNDNTPPKQPALPTPKTAAQHNAQAGATDHRHHFIPKDPKRR